MTGKVVKSTGSWYKVLDDLGKVWNCRMAGKRRLLGQQLTNPVAVGDVVNFIKDAEGGVIKEILPRKNYVVRQSPRQLHQLHLLAANVDQAVVISTIVAPSLKQGFIDRFTLMTEPYDIPTLIVFNKADLYHEDEMLLFEELDKMYSKIGYEVLLVSTVNQTGIELLREKLNGKTSLIAGQSGVGKSSLINAIDINIEAFTDEISDYSGKGQHTTTFAEMYVINKNTFIIDTPGIKTLSFNHLSPEDIAHNFREIFALSEKCKFGNCMHKNEPGCAIKAALESEEIHPWRYNNYLTILNEIEEQNYWERHRDY